MGHERVLLQSIKSLNFYSDENTSARRTQPIPQLTCLGKACSLYQPEAVQCINVGGQGVDINWKCEADLPDALRFGRVTVSCEGWDNSDDPYILKGSCGLEYRLVQIGYPPKSSPQTNKSSMFANWAYSDVFYSLFWSCITAWILWQWIGPWFNSLFQTDPRRRGALAGLYGTNRRGPPPTDGYPPPPPPPYSKNTNSSGEGWRPGFWTGLGVGGAATYLASSFRDSNRAETRERPQAYDWEGTSFAQTPRPSNVPARSSYSARAEGEGSSSGGGSLGPMRRATGIGETRNR